MRVIHTKHHAYIYLCMKLIKERVYEDIKGVGMDMDNTIGVKKGAWTYEEDNLLKAYINKYGEGKWHLIPQRAGSGIMN